MHVLHLCPKMNGLEWGKKIGWPIKEIPLNVTPRKSADPDTGERKPLHERCPYCDCDLDPVANKAIKIANNEQVAYLSANYTHPTKIEAAFRQRGKSTR